jgi:hypothetical protein
LTETKDYESWKELPFIPKINEWINVPEFLKEDEFSIVKQSANCWSGSKGVIESVEYRSDNNNYYNEIIVWCED